MCQEGRIEDRKERRAAKQKREGAGSFSFLRHCACRLDLLRSFHFELKGQFAASRTIAGGRPNFYLILTCVPRLRNY